MEQLCGTAIKPLINVGAIGLNSAAIHWHNLEAWVATMEREEGTSYYLEQALSAMLIADKDAAVLNAKEYIVGPSEDDVKCGQGILHHYVDLSKLSYFNLAWQKLA